MKKILTSLSAIACLGLAATAAHASDGTISFSGNIVAVSCSVGVNGGSSSGNVMLPNIAATAFKGLATTAGDTEFEITLTGCTSDGAKVVGEFENHDLTITAEGRLTNILSPTTGGGATGVELQVLDHETNLPIKLGDASQLTATNQTITNGNATLRYIVRYYANAATVVPGRVASTLPYTISYP